MPFAAEIDLTAEFVFAAAHRLPRIEGPCFNLHGHNYTLRVTVRGAPNPATGLIIDFDVLDKIVRERVLSKCDHKYLNDFIDNPSCEEILRWIWPLLEAELPALYELELNEMPRFSAKLRRA